jgi:hypothetical protein
MFKKIYYIFVFIMLSWALNATTLANAPAALPNYNPTPPPSPKIVTPQPVAGNVETAAITSNQSTETNTSNTSQAETTNQSQVQPATPINIFPAPAAMQSPEAKPFVFQAPAKPMQQIVKPATTNQSGSQSSQTGILYR